MLPTALRLWRAPSVQVQPLAIERVLARVGPCPQADEPCEEAYRGECG